jgi:hypothetical protein
VYALQNAAQAWKDIAENLPGAHGLSPREPGAARTQSHGKIQTAKSAETADFSLSRQGSGRVRERFALSRPLAQIRQVDAEAKAEEAEAAAEVGNNGKAVTENSYQ